jgi:hypothetical protein
MRDPRREDCISARDGRDRFVAVICCWGLLAHIGIRQGNSAIPEVDEVLALASEAERPIRLFDIKTSTQRGSDGSVVLHPIFVLE